MASSFLWNPNHRPYWHYLSLQYKTHFHSQNHLIFLVIMVATALLLTLLTVIRFKQPHPNQQVLGLKNTSVAFTQPPSPTPIFLVETPTPVPDLLFTHLYSVTLKSQAPSASISGVLLADALVSVLNLPLLVGQPYPIQRLIFDTREHDPWSASGAGIFNGRYFLLLSDSVTLIPNLYQKDWLQAAVQPVASAKIPFLLNHSFCVQDSDCRMRKSYCDYGAYNPYENFVDTYACALPTDPTTILYDPVQKCAGITEFKPVKCQSNQCQTQSLIRCLTPTPTL